MESAIACGQRHLAGGDRRYRRRRRWRSDGPDRQERADAGAVTENTIVPRLRTAAEIPACFRRRERTSGHRALALTLEADPSAIESPNATIVRVGQLGSTITLVRKKRFASLSTNRELGAGGSMNLSALGAGRRKREIHRNNGSDDSGTEIDGPQPSRTVAALQREDVALHFPPPAQFHAGTVAR
jgi:hypothetical protein